MQNIRKIIEERLENAKYDYECHKHINLKDSPVMVSLESEIQTYQDCLNLIDEYTPKIVTKQLSVKEIETLLQDLNKPHQFIIDKPAPRTEQDILNDFEKLGYEVVCNSDRELILEQELKSNYTIINRIHIDKQLQSYSKSQFAYRVGSSPLWVTMQEHKLLNELFICWGWL